MKTERHPTVEERLKYGKSLRRKLPRSHHAVWKPTESRVDPVQLLEAQNLIRLEWLVPVRRGRMSTSPFAFFRGGARIMAADLASTPVTGLNVQLCGDAHLDNFGLFASPERQLVFDITDFDETIEGPWEWDIKRLATSFTIAARHNRLKKKQTHKVTKRVVRAYRTALQEFASVRNTDTWYAMLDEEEYLQAADETGREDQAQAITAKAKTKDSLQALAKLTEDIGGAYRIKHAPPGLIPLRELRGNLVAQGHDLMELAKSTLRSYQKTVPDDCKCLLEKFHLKDVAIKVVGVGSVGTLCMILLLQGRDRNDPLFLQLKESTHSVLEEYLHASPYKNQGQRVVEGQRLMQTVSDIFLGWVRGATTGKDFYIRQLRDWKGSADVEDLSKYDLRYLAKLCGWTLARAHARSGDPVVIAAYLGAGDKFDDALVKFADAYADQNERDYEAFVTQIRQGNLEVKSD